ncbi:unnamed protein product [Trichobilharzia regenti]|nr:unnamed protein product [Trichobilharzia regenti]
MNSTTPQFYFPTAHSASSSTSLVPFIPPTNPVVQSTNPFLLNSNNNINTSSSNQLMLANFPSNQFTNPNPMLTTFPAPMMKSTFNSAIDFDSAFKNNNNNSSSISSTGYGSKSSPNMGNVFVFGVVSAL